MKNLLTLIVFIGLATNLFAWNPKFKSAVIVGQISESSIDEASGLAVSRKNIGVIYTHNDGGDGKIYALSLKGELIATFKLPAGIVKSDSDFEDIAVGTGPKPGVSYIYFGDHGDNNAVRTDKSIIRFEEPAVEVNNPQAAITLQNVDVINFKFDDGLRDCETLMIDPWTNEIILVSKRETYVSAYRLVNPETPNSNQYVANKFSTLKFGKGSFAGTGVTGGDISSDGKEILIRDYSHVYYFFRETGGNLGEILAQDPYIIPEYVLFPNVEPQGEAVAWDAEANNFYTTSETKAGIKSSISKFQKEVTGFQSQKKSQEIININNNKIIINADNDFNFGQLELVNSTGKIVESIIINEKNVIISLENLETGTYFVRYICGQTTIFDKTNIIK